MSVLISAIICTRNRPAYLRKAIKSLADQTLPIRYYEILIVDNSSTDHAQLIVSQEFAYVNNVRYLYEPIMGIARARNKGWTEATGKYVCYLDDDAIAPSDWLEKMVELFKMPKYSLSIISGRVDPIWESPRPTWLSDKLLFYLGIRDLFDKPFELKEAGLCCGTCNTGFPRTVFEKMGGFNTDFKRGEDTLFQLEAMSKGHVCLYHPDLTVKHHISPDRLRKSHFFRWAFYYGVTLSKIILRVKSPSEIRRPRMVALTLLRIFRDISRLLDAILRPNIRKRFHALCSTITETGYIAGLIGIVK